MVLLLDGSSLFSTQQQFFNVRLTAGVTTVITCSIKAIPPPTSIELVSVNNGTRVILASATMTDNQQQFDLNANVTLTLADNGIMLECVARNDLGESSTTSMVIVQGTYSVSY